MFAACFEHGCEDKGSVLSRKQCPHGLTVTKKSAVCSLYRYMGRTSYTKLNNYTNLIDLAERLRVKEAKGVK